MGFPVSYRSGARKYYGGGFQEPAVVPPKGPYKNPMKPPYEPPPKPANDPYGPPANDNEPGGGRWEHPPFPKSNEWPGFAAGVSEQAFWEFVPPQYRFAYDVVKLGYDFYAKQEPKPELHVPPGVIRQCGPADPPITG